MSHIEEARSRTSAFLEGVIRANQYRLVRMRGLGFEELDQEAEDGISMLHAKIMDSLEEQYEVASGVMESDDKFAHEHLYYSIFSSQLVCFIIGSNIG